MKRHYLSLFSALLVVIAFAGCKTKETKKPDEKKQTPLTQQYKQHDMSYAWQGFPQPAPTPEASKILIEKRVPSRVRPNQQFTFTIDVRNNAGFAISDLVLTEKIPNNFKMSGATPRPSIKKGKLVWDLGTFPSGKKQSIKVTGRITSPGAARYFGDSDLSFDLGQFKNVVEVIQPKLDFQASAPGIAIINERIPVELTFRNSGKAPVIGTKLIHTLPKGLLTFEGKSKIDINVGDFKPGQTKTKNLVLKGVKTGNYNTTFVAVAEEGLSAKANMKVKVTQPALKITGNAPRKRFVGNIIPYEINVKNVGDAVTKQVTVLMNLPEGTSLTSADEGGIAKGQTVIWRIKSLHPGEQKKLVAKVVANKIMIARVVASAETKGADPEEAVMVTDVAGVAALLGTLIDINDPVPVGENEIYEITTTNQGSLPATKIRIKCILEDSMEYVKSTGATKATLSGKVLTFEPLPALAPHAKAVWRVTVKAKKPGDVRFTVYMESDQLTRPVEILEATHFYE